MFQYYYKNWNEKGSEFYWRIRIEFIKKMHYPYSKKTTILLFLSHIELYFSYYLIHAIPSPVINTTLYIPIRVHH